MAKKMIRPIRTETEYDEALEEIEQYFESEPKPGTSEADRFDLLALTIEDYERKRWPIDPPETIDAIRRGRADGSQRRKIKGIDRSCVYRSGARRPMKMGTIVSLWRYDAMRRNARARSGHRVLRSNLRCVEQRRSDDTAFEKLQARLLTNPKVKAEYDAIAPEFEIAAELRKARLRAGLSQAELAARMSTSQSTIAPPGKRSDAAEHQDIPALRRGDRD